MIMAHNDDMLAALSPKRKLLCSFERSYQLALQRADERGMDQIVIVTGHELQPHIVVDAIELLPGYRFAGYRPAAIVHIACAA